MSAATTRSDHDARLVPKAQADPQPTGDRELSDAELDRVSGGYAYRDQRRVSLPKAPDPFTVRA